MVSRACLLSLSSLLLLAARSEAQRVYAVMENQAASGNTIKVSTPTTSVSVATTTQLGTLTAVSSAPASVTLVLRSTNSQTANAVEVSSFNATRVSSLTYTGDLYLTGSHYVDGTQGVTVSACGANRPLLNQATSGGIVTGGTCATADVGLLNSTQTWTGQNTFSNNVTFSSAVYTSKVSTAIVSSDQTGITSNFTYVSGSSLTLSNVSGGGMVMCHAQYPILQASAADFTEHRWLHDETSCFSGSNGNKYETLSTADTTATTWCVFSNLPSGSHTFRVEAKTGGGGGNTLSIRCSSSTSCLFACWEVH